MEIALSFIPEIEVEDKGTKTIYEVLKYYFDFLDTSKCTYKTLVKFYKSLPSEVTRDFIESSKCTVVDKPYENFLYEYGHLLALGFGYLDQSIDRYLCS